VLTVISFGRIIWMLEKSGAELIDVMPGNSATRYRVARHRAMRSNINKDPHSFPHISPLKLSLYIIVPPYKTLQPESHTLRNTC
jgi:hypothetical protein